MSLDGATYGFTVLLEVRLAFLLLFAFSNSHFLYLFYYPPVKLLPEG